MSGLDGEVQIPKIGGVKKKTLMLIAVPAVAFVGWRYWQARGAGSYEEEAVDPGYEDGGTIPSVDGAYLPDNGYGIGGGGGSTGGTVDDYGFHGTTNAQWTQYAATQLVASDKWSYTDILTALGKYLNNKPLSTMEIDIVQAAIAVAGYPPVGDHPIIPATSSSSVSLPAPSNLRASNLSTNYVRLDWNSVAGADKYIVRKNGTVIETSGDTQMGVKNLTPNTSYSFTVNARGLDGKEGAAATLGVKTNAQPVANRPPDTNKPPTSSASRNEYPKRRLYYKAVRNDNYTKVANKYKTGLTGTQLYNYQFTAEAGRTAEAKALLKQRGANLIYAGTTIAVPYPK